MTLVQLTSVPATRPVRDMRREQKVEQMAAPNSTIYVVYPRGQKTGGPEALHQLVDALRSQGQDAFLVPHPATTHLERAPAFAAYDAPEAIRIVDAADSIVVVPEVFINDLFELKHALPICWWLSIDNSATFIARKSIERSAPMQIFDRPSRIAPRILSLRTPFDVARIRRSRIVHAVQSSYAWAYLFAHLNVAPSLLSDYTPLDEFRDTTRLSRRTPNLVTFNPVKGGHIIREVMKHTDSSVLWRPIQGMSRSQVVSTLRESGIYIDLGHHPGKDRLPREAAISGALTIVSRRGSGAFYGDVPIPWEHKVTPGRDEVANVTRMIPELIDNLQTEVGKQDYYRAAIEGERSRFNVEVGDVFVKRHWGKDALDYRAP